MMASRRLPTSRFQPGIAAMYACTGASPSAFAICGLPPESRTTASLAARLALAPDLGRELDLGADVRCLLARDTRLAVGVSLPGMLGPGGSEFLRDRNLDQGSNLGIEHRPPADPTENGTDQRTRWGFLEGVLDA